jgi:hypothetical protein
MLLRKNLKPLIGAVLRGQSEDEFNAEFAARPLYGTPPVKPKRSKSRSKPTNREDNSNAS